MASIEELDFELRVKDQDFENKIKKCRKDAESFNTDVSKLLDMRVQLNQDSVKSFSQIKDILKDISKTKVNVKMPNVSATSVKNQQAINEGMREYIQLLQLATTEYQNLNQQRGAGIALSQQQLSQIIDQVNAITGQVNDEKDKKNPLSSLGNPLSGAMSILTAYFSAKQVYSFVKQLINVTGEFEKQRIALGAMIGDLSTATRIFEQLKSLAVESPFQVKDLVSYAKQLTAYSIPAEELFQTTKMLADVSAGLGVDMERIILAYGQIRSASFLRGTEVRQLTEAGIPILDELSKQISEFEGRAVSVSEVFDRISNRQVTFEMVKKVFTDMTSEGGQFYNMQETLANSLMGKMSNLSDAWQISMDKIGRSNSVVLGGLVDLLKFCAEHFDIVANAIGGVIVALAAAGVQTAKWGSILTALKGKTALISAAIGATVFVLKTLYDALSETNDLAKSLQIADRYILDFQNSIISEEKKLRELVKALESAKIGTEEYEKAKVDILNAYDAQLSAQDKENIMIGKTIGLYESLRAKIVETAKAKYKQEAMTELDTSYQESLNTYMDRFQTWQTSLEGKGYSDAAFNQLRNYITGGISFDELDEETKRLLEYNKQQQQLLTTISTSAGVISLAGSSQIVSVENLKNGIDQAWKEYQAGVNKLNATFEPKIEELDEMRELVAELAGNEQSLAWDRNKSWYEYIDALRKQYEQYTEQIKEHKLLVAKAKQELSSGKISQDTYNAQESGLTNLESKLATIEKIAKELGIVLDESQSKTKSTTNSATKDISNQIQEIQKIITIYRKLRDARNQLLSAGIGENEVNDKLKEMFSFDTEYVIDDYEDKIKELIGKARALANDPNISASAKNSLISIAQGLESDKFREYITGLEEATKATEKFNEALEKFKPSSELTGTGAEFDTTKAILTYLDAIQKIGNEYERLKNLTSDEENLSLLSGYNTGNMDNEASKLNDKMREIGKSAVSEFFNSYEAEMKSSDYNPIEKWTKSKQFKKDVNSLATMDVSSVMQSIQGGKSSGYPLIDDLADKIKQKLGSTSQAYKAIENIVEGVKEVAGTSNTKQSFTDKAFDNSFGQSDIGKWCNVAAEGLGQVTQGLNEYAKASNNRALEEGTEILGGMMNIFQGFLQGGIVGAAMAAFQLVVTTVIEELSYASKLNAAIEKARNEAQLLKWNEQMETDTIFGTNQVKQMREAIDVMDQITEKYQELYKTLENQNISGDFWQGAGSLFTTLLFAGLNIFSGISDAKRQINAYYDAIAKGYSGIEAYIVKFNDRGGLANFFGFADEYTNLKDLIEGLGYEMYDKYGNLNADALQAILDTYDRLASEDREWMEKAIDYSEEYEEAMEKVNEVLESLYGDYVSSIVDSMIDKWITLGTVTADYAEALSDVAKNYAKMAIQSAILENVFTDEFEEKLRNATIDMNTQEVMNLFEDAMSQIEDMTPFVAELLETLDNYFIEDSSSDSLSSGIKSITEETASLLASYVNAIRADVSVTRNNTQVMSTDLKSILGLLPSAPSLAEYLTQIQANTYNTQVATESVLSELRSVIGSESGMTAVRVSM